MRDAGRCLADFIDEVGAESFGFALADAVDAAELVDRPRLDARELPKGRVVEDDVRRHVARAGEAQADGAQPVEQILIVVRHARGGT